MSLLWITLAIVQALLTSALIFLVVGSWRRIAQIEQRLGTLGLARAPDDSGLEVGIEAPPFTVADAVTGQALTLAQFLGQEVVLTFLSLSCQPCRDLVPDLNLLARSMPDAAVVAVLTATPEEASRFARETALAVPILADHDGQVAEAYRATRTPMTIVVNTEGRIKSPAVISNHWLHLENALDGLVRPTAGSQWQAQLDDGAP